MLHVIEECAARQPPGRAQEPMTLSTPLRRTGSVADGAVLGRLVVPVLASSRAPSLFQ